VKKVYKWSANSILGLHVGLTVFFAVGWMFREVQVFYLPLLFSWPLSWVTLGYCPLTKWEFFLRSKYNPTIDANAEAIRYNMQKYFGITLHPRPIYIAGIAAFFVLLTLSFVPGPLFQ